MDKIPLCVIVLARNEAPNLPKCLSSVRFASDVVVVDDYSDDKTVEVAEGFGVRVCQNHFKSFADQRNWAMAQAGVQTDWVLHLDADEVITPELASSIQRVVSQASPDVAGYFLCFKTMLHGQWLRFSSTFPVWILRLVRKDRVKYVAKGHGESFEADGTLLRLAEPFLHYNFSKGLSEWFAKHNRYSSREAEAIVNANSQVGMRNLFARDPMHRRSALKRFSWRLPCRSFIKFFYMYCLRLGVLDGRAGLTYCSLQAFYEYMICLKVRELQRLRANENSTKELYARSESAVAGGSEP